MLELILSPFQQHVQTWKNCTNCHLHEHRRNVVIGRGTIPADILFIGEAPGQSEDALGYSFAGPAGHLLDRIISKAFINHSNYTYYITNLVCCIPKKDGRKRVEEPTREEILSCRDRLNEIYSIASPKLIITVGKLAKSYLDKTISHRGVPSINIMHPAAILRSPYTVQSLNEQKQVLDITQALEELNANAKTNTAK